MHRTFLTVGAVMAALAVALGAFGAHGLRKVVPPEVVSTFETAVRYHFYHSVAMMIAGIAYGRFRNRWARISGWSFFAGIILFSGSLYTMTFMKSSGSAGVGGIGIVTPVGGLFFIVGWLALAIAFNARQDALLKSVD